jgi:methylenetetrahydrofolate reductase (NADPH)
VAPTSRAADSAASVRLIRGFSLEMTAKDVPGLTAARYAIPALTKINITFLGNEDLEMRIGAAKTAKDLGFNPVPHISARRLSSQAELEEFLARLQEVNATQYVFIVGGDIDKPEGPYCDSISVIRTGLLARYGVREVGIAGYPQGHPDIPTDVLWAHLEGKAAALEEQELGMTILTQFAFDTDPVLAWIRGVRDRGIGTTIRVGIPGPTGVRRLLSFAGRFGIGANAMIVKKYGFSLTNLIGTAGPERFIRDLADEVAAEPRTGDVRLHFYTFGGLLDASEWARDFIAASPEVAPRRSR